MDKQLTDKNLQALGIKKVFVDEEIGNEHWQHYRYISEKDNGYVSGDDESSLKFLRNLFNHGISPEKSQPSHNVCSIGFSEEEQKWYGWSHRAIYGFEVGHKCKKGDCGVALKSEKIKAPVDYPEPGFVCKTLDDCKKCAIAFADSVS